MDHTKKVRVRLFKTYKKLSRRMTASQIMALGFLLTILAGSFLLSLPVCNANGTWLAYIDALFTACSAVCVTGLVTIVPAVQFNLLGKIILLILIQVGGLGIIACTMGVFLILRRQITLRDRVMIQDSYDLHSMSGIVKMVRYVILATFIAEGIGALLYTFHFVPEYGLLKGIWFSVFHAVSAFCNAGIDILGPDSLMQFQTNPYMSLVTALIIIISGLGFLTWKDIWHTLQWIRKREYTPRRAIQKMKVHSKLVLIMTALLLLGGTVLIFFMEYDNPRTLGNLNFGQKWLAAFFQSVTTRTAGFFTIPQDHFLPESQLLSCLLMFIGGSPGGTAGGVKTTTIALLYLNCWAALRGTEEVEVMRRRMLRANVRTAFAVVTVALTAIMAGTMTILVLEDTGLLTALYEVVSAVGTVGLTAGLTPLMSGASKCVIIILMYLGRLSPVTLALLFANSVGRTGKGRKLPEERIMVG